MLYVMFLAVSLISACAIYFYCGYEKVMELPFGRDTQEKVTNQSASCFSLPVSIAISGAMAAVLFFAQWSLYQNTQWVGFVKLYGLLVIVVSAGLIDLKRKIIPNVLVLFGLLFWVGISVYEFTHAENMKSILISEGIGFLVGFGLLALVFVFTKGALGFGDVKLFGIIGLISGGFCTYSTLLVSLLVSVVVSVVGLIRKKIGRKDAIPFGPCIAIGYLVVIFLSSY